MLALKSVSLSVAGRVLVGPLDAEIVAGSIVSVLGRSGTGKSSLLSYVCGVLPPTFVATGQVLLDGEDISSQPPERRGIGILFQDDLLFPHLSVAENLSFGLAHDGHSRRERRQRVDEALAAFGLEGCGSRDPATLSGGQRARVSLLRTMLAAPRALLLDEPFAHLDPETRETIRTLVFEEARNRKLPTLLVTHDEEDVRAANGPVIRLESQGSPA